MVKAVFFAEDKVQDVGYRVWIMGKILNSNLKGTAVNLPDGSAKVLLEGDKEEILRLYEEVKKEKPELVQNPCVSGLEFDERLAVPDAMRAARALQLSQVSRMVEILSKPLFKPTNTLGIPDGLNTKIDKPPEKSAKALKA